MYELFNNYGECEVRLLTNRDTGKPKGVGFVEYGKISEMKAAIGKSILILRFTRTFFREVQLVEKRRK